MHKNRIIVISVVVEGRSKAEVAVDYGVSYRWVHSLFTRYLAGGWEAIEPRSRRPMTSPTRTPGETEDEVLQLRRELASQRPPRRARHHRRPPTGPPPPPLPTTDSCSPPASWAIQTVHNQPARRPTHSL